MTLRHPEKIHKISNPIPRKPSWIRVKAPTSISFKFTSNVVKKYNLVTVCEEASCPNISECWQKKHATFMILGDTCTRACSFCNVKTGKPGRVDIFEPIKIAKTVKELELEHVVITSVDRDDLPDGGAKHFVNVIDCLKKGGDKCYALGGHTKYLCVTEGERCYIVHPSDTAVALSLFNAGIEIASAVGTKIVPIHSFFVSPSQNILKETILEPDEFVTAVYLPKDSSESRHISKYVKARERQSGDFALVSVGISLKVSSGTIKACSICFGGIAPTPHRSIPVSYTHLTLPTNREV